MYREINDKNNAFSVFKAIFGEIVSEELTELILDYFKGSDYKLLFNNEFKLKRVDVAEVNGECVDYSPEDVISILNKWQTEFVQMAEEMYSSGELTDAEYNAKMEQLKRNEVLLDGLSNGYKGE